MEALKLKMSWMQDVYRTLRLKVDLGIALRPHSQPLGDEPLIVNYCSRLVSVPFASRIDRFEKGGVEGEVVLVHAHY